MKHHESRVYSYRIRMTTKQSRRRAVVASHIRVTILVLVPLTYSKFGDGISKALFYLAYSYSYSYS
eukprot:scaffold288064_cov31-Prasinocladus_malaysianus.AAC.1